MNLVWYKTPALGHDCTEIHYNFTFMSLHPIYYFRGPNYSLQAIYPSCLSLLSLQINPQTHHTFYKCLHESKADVRDTWWEHSSFNGVFESAEVIMRQLEFLTAAGWLISAILRIFCFLWPPQGKNQHQMPLATSWKQSSSAIKVAPLVQFFLGSWINRKGKENVPLLIAKLITRDGIYRPVWPIALLNHKMVSIDVSSQPKHAILLPHNHARDITYKTTALNCEGTSDVLPRSIMNGTLGGRWGTHIHVLMFSPGGGGEIGGASVCSMLSLSTGLDQPA